MLSMQSREDPGSPGLQGWTPDPQVPEDGPGLQGWTLDPQVPKGGPQAWPCLSLAVESHHLALGWRFLSFVAYMDLEISHLTL